MTENSDSEKYEHINMKNISFSEKTLQNIRDDYYLKIIENENAQYDFINKASEIIKDIDISPQKISIHIPTDNNPIYVLQGDKLMNVITDPLFTVGTYEWNTVKGNKRLCVSRIHALLFLTQGENEELKMVIIDAWSTKGTYILDRQHKILMSSTDDDRKIMMIDFNECVRICFGLETFIFCSKLWLSRNTCLLNSYQ